MADPKSAESTDIDEEITDVQSSPSKGHAGKIVLLIGIVLVVGVVFVMFRDALTLESLAARESQLREFQSGNPYVVYGIAFAVYVGVTGLSLPGGLAALSLVLGWYFGFLSAFVMISFASTAGATIAFLVSRYLLRDAMQGKFGERLSTFNHHLETEGAFYLFTLRLIPAVPFFVINLVMGLTPMKARTFWWVSQLGMLPGTAVYVYAGSRVPNLTVLAEKGAAAVFSPSQLTQIAIAFALLGLFPLIVKKVLNRLNTSAGEAESEAAAE